MRRIFLGALASAGLSLTAVQGVGAADMPVKAAPAYVHNWTRCYVGVAGGGSWGNSRQDNSAGTITGDFNISGAIIGGTIGCNYQFARTWVIGIEDDFILDEQEGDHFRSSTIQYRIHQRNKGKMD